MDASLDRAINAARDLLSRVGHRLSDHERTLLLSSFDSLDGNSRRIVASLLDPLFKGFFYAAADGKAYFPKDAIKQKFGSTLEENYAGSSEAFMHFATTYWTFKVLYRDIAAHQDKAVAQLFGELEQVIASVFFPTPGPITIPTAKREETQRKLIADSGANINVEEFIAGNPILGRRSSGGCLSIILGVAGFLVFAVLLGALFL